MRSRICFCWLALVFSTQIFVVNPLFAQRGRDRGGNENVWKYYAEKYDKDSDGKLTKTEYDRGEDRFTRLDKNKDGVLTKDDWAQQTRSRMRGTNRTNVEAPTVGDLAPDFELVDIKDPTKKVTLSSFKGKKPVALIFGSCT